MVKPVRFDESGDSEDLQALFDSIAAGSIAPEPPPSAPDNAGDSDELQALFDSVAAHIESPLDETGEHGPALSGHDGDGEVFNRLGHMARQLHDSLRQLGYDKALEESARQIPDARQRLAYIVQMTEQAASKVLNAVDIAKPLQDGLLGQSQDFQDLTGQVIRKVVDIVEGFETQLLQVLIEALPAERKAEVPAGLMNGPVVSAAGRLDIVSTQSQVDELLESLGF